LSYEIAFFPLKFYRLEFIVQLEINRLSVESHIFLEDRALMFKGKSRYGFLSWGILVME